MPSAPIAAPDALVGGIVCRGLVIAILGVVVGMAGAIKLGSIASPLIHEVSANDAVTFSIVVVSMLAIFLFAVLLPGYRAAHVDPVLALRSE